MRILLSFIYLTRSNLIRLTLILFIQNFQCQLWFKKKQITTQRNNIFLFYFTCLLNNISLRKASKAKKKVNICIETNTFKSIRLTLIIPLNNIDKHIYICICMLIKSKRRLFDLFASQISNIFFFM